jgi:radical S-adenosyl methionine domain-containing protein 2
MHKNLLPEAVNYHLNKNCNFRCKGCYATFDEDPSVRGAMLPRKEMFSIVEAIAAAPLPAGKTQRKLTFAGGEPTLCPWLPELIAHAKDCGLVTMVVTNGSRCTSEYLRRLAPVLDWLTVSIDSLNDETNRAVGRHDSKRLPLGATTYADILAEAAMLRLRTKINTVVNRINCHEDMSGFIADSGIARWKVLQVMPVEGQNDAHIDLLAITRAEFDAYVARHARVSAAGIRVVPEPVTAIRGSYAMIDPQGRFFDSSAGHHTYSAPILTEGIEEAFVQVSFDRATFEARGGSYEFLPQGTTTTTADVLTLDANHQAS